MRTTAAEDVIFGLTRMGDTSAAGLSADDVAQVVNEAARFCREAILPGAQTADREGARYANGTVTTPRTYPPLYKQWMEGGWQGLSAPEEFGGQALPGSLWVAMMEFALAADTSFALGPLLTAGAIECLDHYASAEQKARLLPHMVSGEWTGAMCLTEPQSGSDLGTLRTRAEPLGDGRYALHGQKIYITWGDHDCTGNIVYLVLARLPDAPPGSRGISLFVATKMRTDGTRNALRCGGIEHKMGIHASPTCIMLFEGAEAELVGTPHRGLNAMFAMMNNARLAIAVQGVAHGARALELAEAYAAEREQGGRKIEAHPDVARMLMEMRASTLAARLIALETAAAGDRFRRTGDPEAELRLALLTPIAKAWCTERGVENASTGVQVHGGMGYCEDAGAAQVLRDARIAPIYEGTNGIQAIDLVARKLGRDQGAAMRTLIAEARDAAPALATTLDDFEGATALIVAADPEAAQSVAFAYVDAAGWVLGAWLLARAVALDERYEETECFFRLRMLPRALARFSEIRAVLSRSGE
ncbi:MAG: acyl-CoA dehydrogenase [Rhodospirillales bacterium]|nr:acyl-CoA dehydrogenase [Rhodospirillales bacterium]